MVDWWWIALASAAVAAVILAVAWRPWREACRRRRLAGARSEFHRRRERLECLFWQLAGQRGKPRGLKWVECDFDDDVIYARDRATGELSALVGVTIRFAAIEGGPMEGVNAVSNLRAATAVFRFDGKLWTTEGRAIFNLNPAEAVAHFHDSLILIGKEPAHL